MDPASEERARRHARLLERTDVVCLGWWAAGGPLLSRAGVAALLSVLIEVLPEAVPSRWDIDETWRHSLKAEGVDALVDFVDAHRGDDGERALLRAKAPARNIELYVSPAWGTDARHGSFRVTHLLIELDASILDRRGAGERLPAAFERLSELIRPFYAEARILRNVAKHAGAPVHRPGVDIYPFQWNQWYGLPVRAPVAAVLGEPYLERWPTFGTEHRDGMGVDNRRPWRRDMTPLAWDVPAGLCQPFDCGWVDEPLPAWMSPPGRAFRFAVPEARAPIWLLDEPPPLVVPVAAQPGAADEMSDIEEIRQVAVDDEDGEGFEAWARVTAEPDIRAVYVSRSNDADWTWRVEVAVMEFVRHDSIETELRGALAAALSAVADVAGVTEKDREVWLVRGSPAGRELIAAATAVIDARAGQLRAHYRNL